MKKTLLLCFIHGFKGDELTFGDNYAFTEHLRQLVAKELPKVEVKSLVYPKYETRGDLAECVGRFRDWLMNKVIDLEVTARMASPTVNSSLRCILIGHSMGGIVAAETAIALSSEKPIHGRNDPAKDDSSLDPVRPPTPTSSIFPYIQGVLGLDTPYLGIAPGVVAHGAESHYNAASEALAQVSALTGLWSGAKAAQYPVAKHPKIALPAAESSSTEKNDKAKTGSGGGKGWGSWGTIARAAGAVGALAAGGATAYYKREQISSGLTWAGSHLEFIKSLGCKEELRRRVAAMTRLQTDEGVGFGNLYTRLGQGAPTIKGGSVVETVLGNERTFCIVPAKEKSGEWLPAVNNKASNEITAHTTMFEPKENPGYELLANDAKRMIANWLQNSWYESSTAGFRGH